jgi:hypothetical protein
MIIPGIVCPSEAFSNSAYRLAGAYRLHANSGAHLSAEVGRFAAHRALANPWRIEGEVRYLLGFKEILRSNEVQMDRHDSKLTHPCRYQNYMGPKRLEDARFPSGYRKSWHISCGILAGVEV